MGNLTATASAKTLATPCHRLGRFPFPAVREAKSFWGKAQGRAVRAGWQASGRAGRAARRLPL
jgi:hypothetical protein